MKKVTKVIGVDLEKEEAEVFAKALLLAVEINDVVEHDDERHDCVKPAVEEFIRAAYSVVSALNVRCVLGIEDLTEQYTDCQYVERTRCLYDWKTMGEKP